MKIILWISSSTSVVTLVGVGLSTGSIKILQLALVVTALRGFSGNHDVSGISRFK